MHIWIWFVPSFPLVSKSYFLGHSTAQRYRKVFSQGKFWKILKFSHFSLGFSPDKTNNQIEYIQRVSAEFSELDFENLDKTL